MDQDEFRRVLREVLREELGVGEVDARLQVTVPIKLLYNPATDLPFNLEGYSFSFQVTQPIGVGNAPGFLAVGSGAVWVVNTLDDTVSAIDPETNSVVHTIAVGNGPAGIRVSERKHQRRARAAAAGSMMSINVPVANSNPATDVRRGKIST